MKLTIMVTGATPMEPVNIYQKKKMPKNAMKAIAKFSNYDPCLRRELSTETYVLRNLERESQKKKEPPER